MDIHAPKKWIPLLEYAVSNGVSMSTLRRHIKAGKLVTRSEKGRYLVEVEADEPVSAPVARPVVLTAAPTSPDLVEVQQLKRELQKAKQEIAELQTLIALYESDQGAHA